MENVYTIRLLSKAGTEDVVIDAVLTEDQAAAWIDTINQSKFVNAVDGSQFYAELDFFAHPWPTITIAPDPLA